MSLKIILTAFCAVFLAELADKTQIVGISLSAKSGRPFSVLIGSVLAYAVVTLISVILGYYLSKHIKHDYIRYAGGALFVIMGVLMIAGKI